jgi:outer membrane immunogenic protein
MNKLATCVVAISGLIGTSAFAADMGVPSAPPPAPVWNWTGWYAGVNLGASMGTVKTDFNGTAVTTVTTNIPGLGTFNTPGFPGHNTSSPDGFIGGGQIGYNWQFSPIWVVGIEADFQGAAERDHNFLSNPFSLTGSPSAGPGSPAAVVNGTTVIDYTTKIEWFGTARLRAGYVWGNGNVFTYATGGLAYGKVDVEGTSTVSGTITNLTMPSSLAFSTTHAIGHSDTNTGWVLGYGTEGRLGNTNWTWKVENLYMDLGHLNDTDTAITTVTCGSYKYPVPCNITGVTGGQTIRTPISPTGSFAAG